MKRLLFFLFCVFGIFSFSYSREMVITKLIPSPIRIGDKYLRVGDTFQDSDVIVWSDPPQDMYAKPKSGGLPRHYSASAFKSKSKQNLSLQQYINYTNQIKHPSTLGGNILKRGVDKDLYLEKRIALVIGNSLYENLPDVYCSSYDAEDVTNTLNELGFDTFTYYDLNYTDFYNALKSFCGTAQLYDVALFYYCGHGNQNDGVSYLLPTNANNASPENIDNWISFDALFEMMGETKCKTKLIFLDACRNTPGWQTNNSPSRLDRYNTYGSLVVYSTANNMSAMGEQEIGMRNTPFGSAFLESVKNPSSNVSLTINDISQLVKNKTAFMQDYGEPPQQVYTFGVGDVDFAFKSDKLHFSFCGIPFSLHIDDFCQRLKLIGYNQIQENKSSYPYILFNDTSGYSQIKVYWIEENGLVYMIEDKRLKIVLNNESEIEGYMCDLWDEFGRMHEDLNEDQKGFVFDYGCIAFGMSDDKHLIMQYIDNTNFRLYYNLR